MVDMKKSKGLIGVNRCRYVGIDTKRKWAAGSVLYRAEQDDLVVVFAVLSGKETLAVIVVNEEIQLVRVYPEGTPGVVIWNYIGNVGGTLE